MLEEDGVNSSGVAADAVALEDVTDSPEELKLVIFFQCLNRHSH